MSEKGFTLVEVLVALTILALSLTIILTGLSGGLRDRRTAADYQRAVVLADSKLSSMGVETPLQPGQFQGNFDNYYRWEALVAPYQEVGRNEVSEPQNPPARPFVVTVVVRWGPRGDERSVSLSTLRLATQTR